MLLGILVACSSDTTTTQSIENVEVEEQKSDEKSSEEKTKKQKEAVEESADISYPYTYTDIAGRDVIIESQPKRIVTTYLPLWETLMMLDITPIGASGADNYKATWPPFQDVDLEDVVDVGGGNEANLELVATLEPDIILDQAWDASNVDVMNFEKISPVAVFSTPTKMDWRLSMREVGKVVGKTEKAEAVINGVDETLKKAREKFQESYTDETVVLMSMMGVDRLVYAYRPDIYDKETGLGLNVPEGFSMSTSYDDLTIETLIEMDPDYLFVNVFKGDEAIYEELSNNSVWKSLSAVKNGNVYVIDGAGHACSPMATIYTIEYIVEILTK